MSKLLSILNNLLDFLISYLKHKNDDDKQVNKLNKLKNKIDDSVHNDDDDYINELLNKSIVIILSSSLLLTGCQSVTYVPSDRQIKSITYEGVKGKFVPNCVFSELLKSKVERDYYLNKYGPIK